MLLDFNASHALLLQGPVGPFFRRFADELRSRGIRVTKVNFNPGDALFYRRSGEDDDVIPFRQPMSEWPAFCRELIATRDIDAIFLFGDCRPHHRQAAAIARELDLPLWVFEEGYLRPNWITCERGGVNGNSSLPKDPDFYRNATLPAVEPPAAPVGHTFGASALYATLHALAVTLLGWRYPHYRHHRNINAFKQALLWCRGFFRKLWYKAREAPLMERFTTDWAGRYFFVPLQVHCDAQLSHSSFASMEAFIEHVVATFAAEAPPDTLLVLKHHPHDRAYRDYTRFLRTLGARYRCADRLVYIHDLHLPTILRHARGTVTMNSTVGLSSLYHKTPVKVLGTAIYDVPGLTNQADLATFFHAPGTVDTPLYEAFCRYLRHTNQINGSFYRRLPGSTAPSGIDIPRWPTQAVAVAGDLGTVSERFGGQSSQRYDR